jgi:prepilin-type N-terminal cleavage/methylation domain-containing protein
MTGPGLKMGKAGFTLLEVLVSLSLLGIAVTVIFQLYSANLRSIAGSEDYVAAALEAQSQMREIVTGRR